MDYIMITAGTLAAIGVIGIAWLGGYELGQAHAIDSERAMSKMRIDGLLAELNKRKPRTTQRKRRASK